MASLVLIKFSRHQPVVEDDHVIWNAHGEGKKDIDGLPQIIWEDQMPWREANLWATSRATGKKVNIKTIISTMKHVHAFANWLEDERLTWYHFPDRESDRCLVMYRGHLISQRDLGHIAPSTTQHRMNAIIRVYRWFKAYNLISADLPMWEDKKVGVKIQDTFGFERTIERSTTDLAIANRRVIGSNLEDGLLPVASSCVTTILEYSKEHASKELDLMLRLGFCTGMRIGTICDLKIKTIEHATPVPDMNGYWYIAIGPGAHPPVHTKHSVTGQIWIEEQYLNELKEYIYSTRRLKRQALAKESNRQNIFLNRFGRPYATEGRNSSRSVNIEIGRLKKSGLGLGLYAFRGFHFHRTRCTFATELARIGLKHCSVSLTLSLVKNQLLHRDEATTLEYIKFVQNSQAKEELSNEFTAAFLGLFTKTDGKNA